MGKFWSFPLKAVLPFACKNISFDMSLKSVGRLFFKQDRFVDFSVQQLAGKTWPDGQRLRANNSARLI